MSADLRRANFLPETTEEVRFTPLRKYDCGSENLRGHYQG